MAIIDDRTPTLNLALPNKDNALQDDVGRLRSAITAIDTEFAKKGQANGYAGLDGSGKVPAAQLPSYVDDVIEIANFASLPTTGETGKIYVMLDATKAQYRWSGSVYVEVGRTPDVATDIANGLMSSSDKAKLDGVALSAAFTSVVVDADSIGQTIFTVPGGYTAGAVDVLLDGIELFSDDYTASNGSTITLAVGVESADSRIKVKRYKQVFAAV